MSCGKNERLHPCQGIASRLTGDMPGWHYDEDTGALIRDVIHRMGRRCHNWDYGGKGVYQVTLTLEDRKSAALGHLAYDDETGPFIELSAVGQLVEAALRDLPAQWPGVEILGARIMPDHLHVVIAVRSRQKKPLGAIVGSFKSRSTSRWLDLLGRARPSAKGGEAGSASARAAKSSPGEAGSASARAAKSSPGEAGSASARAAKSSPSEAGSASARAPKLWSEGYVDTILFDDAAILSELAYLADNPRRLWEKRAHPELFTVLRDLPVALACRAEAPQERRLGHFAAIGNHNLLKAATILQVQCSRSFFAYARDAKGALLKDKPPRVETPAFREKCEILLEEAAHGAVLVSPCISEGEREIARRAFQAGYRVITLANKGFSPLYKPGGKAFDTCADGRLLMLAPIAWPYLPGEKKMTREDACVLNRLAQQIAGPGAVEIIYKGLVPARVDALAQAAVA